MLLMQFDLHMIHPLQLKEASWGLHRCEPKE